MHLHLHPTRQEALTVDETTLTRWSLTTTPAIRLAQHSTVPFSVFPIVYRADGRKVLLGGVTGAPDGTFFEHQLLISETYPTLSGIELRSWEDLSLARSFPIPQTKGWIQSLDASPDGRWLVIAPDFPEQIFLLNRQTGEVMSHHVLYNHCHFTTGLTFDPTSMYVAGISSHDGEGCLMLWRLDPPERFGTTRDGTT
ncbi:MAG: WD40 repeat domain-containing protein [Ktedonobacteraceae bacterium]